MPQKWDDILSKSVDKGWAIIILDKNDDQISNDKYYKQTHEDRAYSIIIKEVYSIHDIDDWITR